MKKKATKSSNSTSATPPRSASKHPTKSWWTLSATCRPLKATAIPKGFTPPAKAIVHYYQTKGLRDITVNDVYIGNGVSELITMSMQALLNDGDEILIPAPDYPLWTAAATLAGGTVRHYLCDEENDWFPNLADMEAKITPKTKAIVVINPNNPTGAVYSKEILLEIAELARKHGLIIFADEIYDKILYDARYTTTSPRSRPTC